jgi:putative ABC transport system substrate-binding protein
MTLIGGGAAAWPFGAHAQRAIIPVIGYLSSSSRDVHATWTAAYRQGLTETGYVEGQNVALEYRWAEDALDRLPAFADDLVRRQVAVIFASGGPAPALAA